MKVAILTPTIDSRQHFLERCKKIVQDQDYHNIEHRIITGSETIGTKLNHAVFNSDADLFIRFDDDDIYAHDYVSRMVQHMTSTECELSGVSKFNIYQPLTGKIWDFNWNGTQPYVNGSGMAFWRSSWDKHKFWDISRGEDQAFVHSFVVNADRVKAMPYDNAMILVIHGSNTDSHRMLHTFPIQYDNEQIKKVLDLYGKYDNLTP
jgi:hypothetical protein